MNYESSHAALEVAMRCSRRFISVVLSVALPLLAKGLVVEHQLAAGPGQGHNWRDAIVDANAHVERDEAEDVEEPIGYCQDPVVM